LDETTARLFQAEDRLEEIRHLQAGRVGQKTRLCTYFVVPCPFPVDFTDVTMSRNYSEAVLVGKDEEIARLRGENERMHAQLEDMQNKCATLASEMNNLNALVAVLNEEVRLIIGSEFTRMISLCSTHTMMCTLRSCVTFTMLVSVC
jgi:hypothetical protein